MARPEIFFVLNGLINGDPTKMVGIVDGWYVGPSHSATQMGPYNDSKTASWVAATLDPYIGTNIGDIVMQHLNRQKVGEQPTFEDTLLSLLVELVEVDNVLKLEDIKHVLEHWDMRRAEEPSEYM